MQRSDEALREAVESIGVKGLAARLKRSPARIYEWCVTLKNQVTGAAP